MQRITIEEQFLQGKASDPALCEDAIYAGDHYLAVIDGVTAKGQKRYDGKTSGRAAAEVLCRALARLPENLRAAEGIFSLNAALTAAYGCDFREVLPEDRLQASLVVYSRARREIWLFGDCQFMINGQAYSFPKEIDGIAADLRAFCAQEALLRGASPAEASRESRERIRPLLLRQMDFANREGPFGYEVLDGGKVQAERVRVFAVQPGDTVVLASDGYPKLFPTLARTERYLAEMLERDPYCLRENRQTKGRAEGNCSYDDRAYFRFRIPENVTKCDIN